MQRGKRVNEEVHASRSRLYRGYMVNDAWETKRLCGAPGRVRIRIHVSAFQWTDLDYDLAVL